MRNLILTICSNHKSDKGQRYDCFNGQKMMDKLPKEVMRELTDARNWAFDCITKKRSEKPPVPFSQNKQLKRGPDINPDSENRGGHYLPAVKRYAQGRFYEAFHKVVGDVDNFIHRLDAQSDDHLLIVSGLYGLLTPAEPIQNYSCDVSDERDIKRLWKENSLLTSLIVAYIRAHKIVRVFDFMADDSYRHLIDWESIQKETRKTFYSHCHKKIGGKQLGADMLPELGEAAGLLLTGKWKKGLSEIEFNDEVQGVYLRNKQPEWIPAGITPSKREACAVWAMRMVANIGHFLDEEGLAKETKVYTLHLRIKDFERINLRIAVTMDGIRKFRNNVVHHHWYDPAIYDIASARKNYIKILNWAKARAKKRGDECIEVEDVDH